MTLSLFFFILIIIYVNIIQLYEQKKGLIAIPIGKQNYKIVTKTIQYFSSSYYDFMFCRYDYNDNNDTHIDFKKYLNNVNLIIDIKEKNIRKWDCYKKYLTPQKISFSKYSHLFLWDDDIQVNSNFDSIFLLNILQKKHIHAAQPSLSYGCHYEFTRTHYKKSYGIKKVPFVEIMAPIYSVDVWKKCLHPLLLNHPLKGTGYGIDASFKCLCEKNQYVLDFSNISVYHRNNRSLKENNFISIEDYVFDDGYTKNLAYIKCKQKNKKLKWDCNETKNEPW